MWVSFRATGVFGVPTDNEFHKVLPSSPDKHNIWSRAAHCDFHWHHIGLLRPLGQGGPRRSWVSFARQALEQWSHASRCIGPLGGQSDDQSTKYILHRGQLGQIVILSGSTCAR